jgi:hypothetical protein
MELYSGPPLRMITLVLTVLRILACSSSQRKLTSALKWLRDRLGSTPPTKLKITLDGEDLSAECFLQEVLNILHIGPSLYLAPTPTPTTATASAMSCS